MSYENVDVFCRAHIKELESNGRMAYGRCPLCQKQKSIVVNYQTNQFRCPGCNTAGGLLTLAHKLGVSAPVDLAVIAPANQSPSLQSRPKQAPVAVTGDSDVNEPLPPPSFDYIAGRDRETALKWFSTWFFDPFKNGAPLPGEYKKLCRKVYDEVANWLPSAGGRVMDKLDEVYLVWNKCTTRDEFERFVMLIAQLYELSNDAKNGLVPA